MMFFLIYDRKSNLNLHTIIFWESWESNPHPHRGVELFGEGDYHLGILPKWLFGIWCFPYLGFIGLCRRALRIFKWVGKVSLVAVGVRTWRVIPHSLMWGIWRERNARRFEGNENSLSDLKLSFLKTMFEWLNASVLFSFGSLADMLDSCVLCA